MTQAIDVTSSRVEGAKFHTVHTHTHYNSNHALPAHPYLTHHTTHTPRTHHTPLTSYISATHHLHTPSAQWNTQLKAYLMTT